MKLDNCILDIDQVVVSQPEYLGPDKDWQDANSRGVIPANLYRLYCKADYFSFGKAPSYLSDSGKLLFPFLEAMSRGIRDAFLETEELLLCLPELQKQRYSPVKQARAESWSKNADKELTRWFKSLLVNLTGALDQFAEISAVLLYPALDKIPPGRASFSGLKAYIRKQHTFSGLVSPQTHFAEQLKKKLLPLMDRSGPDKDWLELLQLFRNKLAHLGTSAFQYMCFHDRNGEFYTFPPRIWPRFFKQDVKATSNPASNKTVSLESTAKQQLIHCDLVEYSADVTKGVRNLLNGGFECVCDVYDLLKNAPPNQDAANAIMQQYEEYKFEHF